jgi:hypothetical protein
VSPPLPCTGRGILLRWGCCKGLTGVDLRPCLLVTDSCDHGKERLWQEHPHKGKLLLLYGLFRRVIVQFIEKYDRFLLGCGYVDCVGMLEI